MTKIPISPRTQDVSANNRKIESEQVVMPYDENLLERARTQWQFGDWENLAKIDRDTLQHHPERAKLALLAAAGLLQTGKDAEAKKMIRLSHDWGISKKLICQILIAGVHNNLGRAAVIGKQQYRALKHFEKAISIGSPGSDGRLITKARCAEQINQLGLADGIPLLEVDSCKAVSNESKPISRKKNQPDISIVIPVYNLEEVLEKCLISIQLQEHENFEAIIINDGSSDKTSDIAFKFVESDSRFKLIELEGNKGVSSVRNIGIDECKGEFIRFVDGDDELPSSSNKLLLENSLNQDLVRGSYATFGIDKKEVTDNVTSKIISDFHPFSLPFHAKSKLLYGITSTLFSSKFIRDNKLSFPKNKNMAEDAQFMIDAFFSAKRCTLIPDVVYFYKKRVDSLSEKSEIDTEFMLNIANKWMYLLSRAKNTSQLDFVKRTFDLNMNGYLKNNVFSKLEKLNTSDRNTVNSVFDALISEYSARGSQ